MFLSNVYCDVGVVFGTFSLNLFMKSCQHCDDGENLKKFRHRFWRVEPAIFPWIFSCQCLLWRWGTPEEFSASYLTCWAGHISLNFSWNLDKCLPRWKWGTPRWSHQSFRLEIIPIWFAWILRQIDNILVEYALLSHLSQKNMTKISLSSIVFLWFDESFLAWFNGMKELAESTYYICVCDWHLSNLSLVVFLFFFFWVQELVFLASKEKP